MGRTGRTKEKPNGGGACVVVSGSHDSMARCDLCRTPQQHFLFARIPIFFTFAKKFHCQVEIQKKECRCRAGERDYFSKGSLYPFSTWPNFQKPRCYFSRGVWVRLVRSKGRKELGRRFLMGLAVLFFHSAAMMHRY